MLEPILRRSRSEIFLVQALPRSGAVKQAEDYLRPIADRLQQEGVCAHALVEIGPPSQVIENLAANEEVTMIALSAGEGGVGPVAEQLFRDSARPVVALRPAPARRGEAHSRKRPTILAPLDGSESSRRSLPLALDLAGVLDARVILIRVIEREDQEIRALEDLQEEAERLNRRGWSAEIWIESGDPASRILEACRGENIQMIVLTTRGRPPEAGRVLGSVTAQVMKDSPVPVLALHVRGIA